MPAVANDTNVRRHLAAVLRGDESVDAFIDWFHPARFLIHAAGTDEDVDLSDQVELHLAELSGGYIDDEGLLDALRHEAAEFGISWEPLVVVGKASRLASQREPRAAQETPRLRST